MEKDSQERLDIYDAINRCDSYDKLADIIESLADSNGMIQGRHRKFNAKKMADYCRTFELRDPAVLTREYGIRQQALYIRFYSNRL